MCNVRVFVRWKCMWLFFLFFSFRVRMYFIGGQREIDFELFLNSTCIIILNTVRKSTPTLFTVMECVRQIEKKSSKYFMIKEFRALWLQTRFVSATIEYFHMFHHRRRSLYLITFLEFKRTSKTLDIHITRHQPMNF